MYISLGLKEVSQSFRESVNQSVSQSVSRSVRHSVSQSVSQSVSKWFKSLSYSVTQWVSQPVSDRMSQWFSHVQSTQAPCLVHPCSLGTNNPAVIIQLPLLFHNRDLSQFMPVSIWILLDSIIARFRIKRFQNLHQWYSAFSALYAVSFVCRRYVLMIRNRSCTGCTLWSILSYQL